MHGCRLQLAVKEMRLQEKLRREREAVEERAAAKKAVMERRRKVRERKLRAQEKKRDRTRVILKAKVGTSTGVSSRGYRQQAHSLMWPPPCVPSTQHAGLDEIKEKTMREMAARQATRALLAKEKKDRVAMQRKEQEYRHKQAAAKTTEWFKRIELIDELKRAAAKERGAKKRQAIIDKHKFEAENPLLRNVTPVRPTHCTWLGSEAWLTPCTRLVFRSSQGPGAYTVAGGAFDKRTAEEEAEEAAMLQQKQHRSKSAGLPDRATLSLPSPFRQTSPSFVPNTGRSSPTNFTRMLDESMGTFVTPLPLFYHCELTGCG